MPLYRCNNCGKEFEAARPACAACNIDPQVDPRFAAIVISLKVIHFDPPSHVPNFGIGKRPCDGKSIRAGMATGVPGVVNCKACRHSEVWVKAAQEVGLESHMLDGHDELVGTARNSKGELVVKTGQDLVAGVSIMRDPTDCC